MSHNVQAHSHSSIFSLSIFYSRIRSRAKHKIYGTQKKIEIIPLGGWRVCEEFLKHFDWQLTTLSRVPSCHIHFLCRASRIIYLPFKNAKLFHPHNAVVVWCSSMCARSSCYVCCVCARYRCACIVYSSIYVKWIRIFLCPLEDCSLHNVCLFFAYIALYRSTFCLGLGFSFIFHFASSHSLRLSKAEIKKN